MSLFELWSTHDWVVKTLMLAFAFATVVILEKIVQLIRIARIVATKEPSALDTLEHSHIRSCITSIQSFQDEKEALFNANVGVQLDKIENYMMRYVGIVGLIAVLSPMLGLIGTFFGVWHVFEGVGSFGLNEPGVIARGIKEVLIDTMAGLGVAVYATIGYKLLELWIRKLSIAFEEKVYLFLGERHAS